MQNSTTSRFMQGPEMRVFADLVEGETRLPGNLAPLPEIHKYRDGQSRAHPLLSHSLSRQKEEEIQEYLRKLALRTKLELLKTTVSDDDGHELPHTNERYTLNPNVKR